MSRKRKPEPDRVREDVLRAYHQVEAAGGVVLLGRLGPFAFYPPPHPVLVRDPDAPERLLEILRYRLLPEDERLFEDQLLFESLDPETLANEP